MKAYLLDSFNRYRRFSESLDIQTTLCNKEWWVFNDSGEKELYIFQEDGNLIISLNGMVTNASWKFLSVNKSIIINTSKSSILLRPAFKDSIILSLQLDGTETFALLIDESNKKDFQPKSLSDIMSYFDNKLKAIEIEEKKQMKITAKRVKEETEKELEEKRLQEYEKKVESLLNQDDYYLELYWKHQRYSELEEKNRIWGVLLIGIGFIPLSLAALFEKNYNVIFFIVLGALISGPGLVIMFLSGFQEKMCAKTLDRLIEYREKAIEKIRQSLR